MADLIDRAALLEDIEKTVIYTAIDGAPFAEMCGGNKVASRIIAAPAFDAVEVSEIKAYLQSKLDEWDALGDRKFEPANMWGYNFIMACFDDLSSYRERRGNE